MNGLFFGVLSAVNWLPNLVSSQQDSACTEAKPEKKLKQGFGRWKTFSKGMVHRIIATIVVDLA